MPALALSPVPVDRPWGGHRVARRFGWDDSRPRGEWWLASCRPDALTPLRGGAAGAAGTASLASWLAGPGARLGLPSPEDFPLLVKFLDSEALLSLQVHPDDGVAARQKLRCGKTEAWVVLEAAPGACVYLGTADGVSCARLIDRVEAGAGDQEVLSLLRRVEVSSGDVLLVRAGTVHALGPGLAIYEVQQNSDTTWRIYDWGRGRELHLDRAREAAVDLGPPLIVRSAERADATGAGGSRWEPLLAAGVFALRGARVSGRLTLPVPRRYSVLTVLAGRGRLIAEDTRDGARIDLAPGDTVFVHGSAVLEGEALSVLAVDPPE
jgi:mannose-6-phosphate isomerase